MEQAYLMNSKMVKYLVESMINQIDPRIKDNTSFIETLELNDLYEIISERWIPEKECFEMVIAKYNQYNLSDSYNFFQDRDYYLLELPPDTHGGNYNSISDDLDQNHDPRICSNYPYK